MVLTKSEFIDALQNEVRILVHLTTKIEPSMLDYRPTPKQRSTIELLRYLSMMGPALIEAGKAGAFDPAAWTVKEKAAEGLGFDQTVAALAAQEETYRTMIGGLSDADFRREVNIFGAPCSLGAFLVNNVLCGCAAYRTQIFLYLKACGRTELTTMNLWAGMDAPAGG